MLSPARQNVERELLGQGVGFPLLPDRRGQLGWNEGPALVEASIWNILATARGERVMRPEFGCGIHDQVFDTNSDLVQGAVEVEVLTALVRWEPRIDVLGVRVEAPDGRPEMMLIRVDYRIRSVNTVHNLVYPFFINEGRR